MESFSRLTRGARALLLPRHRLLVTGWRFDDLEHLNAVENTHSGFAHNWPATGREFHLVTGFLVLP